MISLIHSLDRKSAIGKSSREHWGGSSEKYSCCNASEAEIRLCGSYWNKHCNKSKVEEVAGGNNCFKLWGGTCVKRWYFGNKCIFFQLLLSGVPQENIGTKLYVFLVVNEHIPAIQFLFSAVRYFTVPISIMMRSLGYPFSLFFFWQFMWWCVLHDLLFKDDYK